LAGNTPFGEQQPKNNNPKGGFPMSLHLPKPIELFMSSENTHDTDTIGDCFAPDATVRDEGRTRTGLNEISAWRRETQAKYRHTVKPIAVAKRAGKTIVTTEMAGDFPGSPVTVDFVFQLKGNRIASLQIGS
jgi:SnoaL-like domain